MAQLKIALVGKKKKDRSFVSNYLKLKHGFRVLGLDDVLDDFLRKLYYTRNHYPVTWEKKLKFYDSWYEIDPNIWITRVAETVKRATANLVVPDLRYPNEVKVLEDLGFTFVRLSSPQSSFVQIKGINKYTPKDNIIYQEWFSREADAYVTCKYSLYIENRTIGKNVIETFLKNLTEENS